MKLSPSLAILICLSQLLPADATAQTSGSPEGDKGTITPLIVGGDNAQRGKWPWMVALVHSSSSQSGNAGAQLCGGALIDRGWVITAAHCVDDLTPGEVDVLVGAHDLGNRAGARLASVVDIVSHPRFEQVAFGYDIALLALETPVDNVSLLPLIPAEAANIDGEMATIIGWGSTDSQGEVYPDILQQAEIPVWEPSELEEFDPAAFVFNDISLAASFRSGGVDTCLGDSGGPLLVFRPDGQGNETAVLAGITSFGFGDCAEANQPGIYTRVSAFLPWIESYLSSDIVAWARSFGLNRLDEDPDLDGRSTRQEYYEDTNPDLADKPIAARISASGEGSSAPLALHYSLNDELSSDDFQILVSEDLENWQGIEAQDVQGSLALPPRSRPTAGQFARIRYKPISETISYPGSAVAYLSQRQAERSNRQGSYRIRDYLIEDAPAGQRIYASLRSNDLDAELELIDSSTGDLIDSDDNSGSGSNAALDFVAQADARYLLRATSSAPEQTGEFVLSIFNNDDLSTQSGTGQIDAQLSQGDPIDTISSHRSLIHYADKLLLDGFAPGELVSVELESSSFDTVLRILDAQSGRIIAADDDGGAGTNSRLYIAYCESAPLILQATSFAPGATGSYRLTLSDQLPADTLGISKGQSRTGALSTSDPTDEFFEGIYYKDDYILQGATPGEQITVTMESSSVDAFLTVIDPNGNELLYRNDDISGSNLNARISFTTEDCATYILRATSATESETGSYTISVD